MSMIKTKDGNYCPLCYHHENDCKCKTESLFGLTPCSLVDCPPGDCKAKLPHFREEPLEVEVGEWTTLDGKHTKKTVSLKRGAASNRYLSDSELEGAEFYPANDKVKS